MKKLLQLFKSDIVFTISFILAVLSTVMLRPDFMAIKGFIDFKTLTLLFVLMLSVKGMEDCMVFEAMAGFLLKKIKDTRSLYAVLVGMCFFTSMFITNDVALITFVPFGIFLLESTNQKNHIISCVVLMTIGANMGSMLLPVGNPQNLYLYTLYDLDLLQFVSWLFPVFAAAFVLLVIMVLIVKKQSITTELKKVSPKKKTIVHMGIFLLSMLCVMGLMPYYVLLPIALLVYIVLDRPSIKKVDYVLLLTFVFFFIFIGNLKGIPEVRQFMTDIIAGRELLTGVIASQFISNVPAAILLSGFTTEAKALLWGVDIGGLGTIIASMASLISYKLYLQSKEADGKKYMLAFTGFSIVFLAWMLIIAFILL